MPAHVPHYSSWIAQAYGYRELIIRLGLREVSQRFRGSRLGMLWLVLQPLAIIATFYFVFVVVFHNRWRTESELPGQFVLSLFAGLIAYNFFAEVVGRAPSLVVNNVNYVKKVVFPLEMLPFITAVPAAVTLVTSSFLWLILYAVVRGSLPDVSALLALPMFIPIALFALGFAWLLSALTVYIRDVGQAVPLVLQALIYASPVLYPLDRVPQGILRDSLLANPLSIPIEAIRAACVDGQMPSSLSIIVNFAAAVFLASVGHAFFMKARAGFADVL